MVLEEKTIICKDCAQDFLFSAGEQGFFLEKGLLNEPQRCPECREQRRRDRTLYHRTSTVVCAECSCETTVPFVPRLNRPVYCDVCFKAERRPAPPIREEVLVEATS